MSINSRSKGCRGERAWRDVLRSHGYNARRGQQFSGHTEAPDVVCDDLPHHRWEVKRVKRCSVYKYLEQALRDCRNIKYPTVALKADDKPWIVITYADDYLRQIAETDLPRVSRNMPLLGHPSRPLDACGVDAGGRGKIDSR